jgi:hypothetical protein
MDITRIQREFADAQRTFALVELRPTTDGKVYARTALQTMNGCQCRLKICAPIRSGSTPDSAPLPIS